MQPPSPPAIPPPTPLPAASPSEQKVAEHIRALVARLDASQPLTTDMRKEMLETFEQYECWAPYFRLVKQSLEDPKVRKIDDFVRLASVQNLYLEDVFSAAETCAQLVSVMGVGYRLFSEEVLLRVIEFEDYAAEATILSAVCEHFSEKADHVSCLERLCMLYEKKTHSEAQLQRTYERLLAVDSHNVKALRYFKLVFTQSNDWEEVVGILKTLLGCVTHPQEVFRVAQELATIYLYQLDMAEEAIAIVESHCSDSPLDTSNIRYDAYTRLADWNGCLRVLRQCLLDVDDDSGRSVLHLKIGSLHEQLGQWDQALENFARAAKLQPELLDATEGIINIAILKRDWALLDACLKDLADRVKDERLNAQLRQAVKRLQDGLSHVKPA